MGPSIPEIARDNREFIVEKLTHYAQVLQPSSTEDEELIRRAVFTVRNRSVVFERYIPFSSTLYTIVQDVRSASVTIDFKRDTISCSCPASSICRHEMGALLALYQYFGSVQEWRATWQAQKSAQLHLLADERSPESWQQMVEEVLGHILTSNTRIEDYMLPSIIETVRTKLRRHMPYEREWQPLFHLYVELAALNKLWLYLAEKNTIRNSNYFTYYLDRAIDKMNDALYDLSGVKLFSTDSFYDALQTMIRDLLLIKSNHLSTRFSLYLKFWGHLFTEKSRAEQELATLADLPDSATVRSARMLHYMRLEQKDFFTSLLAQLTKDDIELLIKLAHFAQQTKKLKEAETILQAILPYLRDYIQQTILPMERQRMTFYLNQLYEMVQLNEEQELALYAAYGHYGVQPYSEYLLRNERYSEWVALHQLYPSSIAYLDSCGLKAVVAAAPALTLPLYHHYALEEIAQKSRMNYKQAVRIWRSMKSAAKKSGQQTFWENYMNAVRQQYKRLRALQEEIDKSNLLV